MIERLFVINALAVCKLNGQLLGVMLEGSWVLSTSIGNMSVGVIPVTIILQRSACEVTTMLAFMHDIY